MNTPIIPLHFVAAYNSRTRDIAIGIKRRERAVIQQAALDMASLIPAGSVLVPAPSHTGVATDTLVLAQALAALTGCSIADIVTGRRRESVRTLKKLGRPIDSGIFGFTTSHRPDGLLVVIDNVYATGMTANAVATAVHASMIVTHSRVA